MDQGNKAKRIIATVLAIVALVLVAVVGFVGWNKVEADRAARERHSITLPLTATSFDTSTGSKLPVHVTGTNASGSVDGVQFVDDQGAGMSLTPGTYQLDFPASPIAADGSLYTLSSSGLGLTIADVDRGASVAVNLPEGTEIALAPVDDPATTSDDDVNRAKDYASREGACPDGVSADDLAGKAADKRNQALADKKAAEEKAAAEQRAAEEKAAAEAAAAARHVKAAEYEFDIPQYWVGRVNAQVNGNEVDIYSKKYPSRKVCWVEVEKTEYLVAGDIGTSQMGLPVPLDSTRSVQVWANRWAYQAASDFWRNQGYASISHDEAVELTDLQSGGSVSYDAVEASMGTNGPEDPTYMSAPDDYISANVTDTIKPL